jgi:hypothetical protein
MRIAVLSIAFAHLSACGNSTNEPDEAYAIEPDQSYTFPEALIGIPVRSPSEAQQVRQAVVAFALQYRLRRYRRIEDAPAEARTDPSWWDLQVSTSYISRAERSGFDVTLSEYSKECFVVALHERSGIWRPRTLSAWSELQRRLSEVTADRSISFTEPRKEQNWPTQRPHPDRPVYPAQLCVRMGFTDPRPVGLIKLQGPLK